MSDPTKSELVEQLKALNDNLVQLRRQLDRMDETARAAHEYVKSLPRRWWR